MPKTNHHENFRRNPALTKRTERRKERTRRLLKDMALALFYEKGLYWTTVEDITDRADVGKGTFYHYFPTKEALILTLLQDGHDQVLDRVREAVRTARPGGPAVSAATRALLDFYAERPDFLLLFHQIRGFLQLRTAAVKELHGAYAKHLDELGRVVKRAFNGRAVSTTHRGLGIVFSAFTSGLVTYHLLFSKAGEMKRRRDHLQRQIERSIYALV
jgi:AcrR family transcriptional regulator